MMKARKWTATTGRDPMADAASPDALTNDDYRTFALSIAHRDVPRTLTWIGGVVLVFTVINAVVPPATSISVLAGDVVIGLAMIIGGLFLDRPGRADWQIPWAFVGIMTAFVIWMLVVFISEPMDANLTYILVTMTAFGPLTFSWRAFFVGGGVMLGASFAVLTYMNEPDQADWTVGLMAGLVVSGVLLRLRLRLLRDLAEAQHDAMGRSTSDALTGLLNRHGIRERLDTLWADAIRRSEPVSVYFLDVRGLKKANDEHGHEIGDQVIRDVADAIRNTVRGGDLAARWGGDEFVILGVGNGLSADALSERLNERFTEISQIRRTGWVGPISVGHSVGLAKDHDFENLLLEADQEMYSRRFGPGVDRTITVIVIAGQTHYYATCMKCAWSTKAYLQAAAAESEYEKHACED